MTVALKARLKRRSEKTEEAVTHPVIRAFQRYGYAVRGVLYGAMGVFALLLAVGSGQGRGTDQRGSLVALHHLPAGRLVVLAFIIGIAPYALWGFVRAIYDPLRRGDDPEGLAQRAGFAWSGLAYSSLAFFALQVFVGHEDTSDSVQGFVMRALAAPFGRWLAVAAGLVAVMAGLSQFVDAWRASFRKDMKRSKMTRQERATADGLGRVGFLARGTVFTLTGWFILEAGWHADPAAAHGFGGAFVFILTRPYGHLLLALVALGFVAMGLHSLLMARYARLEPR